ncbi:MAG TPA: ABC transporter substrate-binding protein, partial [Candidatus Binatia bacterium]
MNYRAYQWIKYRRIMNVGRFKTKRGLAASLFVLGVVNIFLADLAESQERKKIVAAYVAASEQMIVPTLAQETGIFRKQGLDAQIVLVSGSPRNVQSLIAGNFDYTMAGVTPLVRARLSGADPVILAAIANYSSQRIIVAPQMRIHKLEELRGKIVGVTQYGSEGDTFLRIALKTNRDASTRIMQKFMAGLPAEIVTPLYNEARERLPLPLPMKDAIQAVFDREPDARARAL